LSKRATRMGIKRLIGEYRATSKNKMVSNHYEKLGFVPIANVANADTSTVWTIDLPQPEVHRHHIEVNIADEPGPSLRRTHEDIS
jgi:predicted enzyme involved in methoxymalonyl-ACP biosynthesis